MKRIRFTNRTTGPIPETFGENENVRSVAYI